MNPSVERAVMEHRRLARDLVDAFAALSGHASVVMSWLDPAEVASYLASVPSLGFDIDDFAAYQAALAGLRDHLNADNRGGAIIKVAS
jgi:hypothetical protein